MIHEAQVGTASLITAVNVHRLLVCNVICLQFIQNVCKTDNLLCLDITMADVTFLLTFKSIECYHLYKILSTEALTILSQRSTDNFLCVVIFFKK